MIRTLAGAACLAAALGAAAAAADPPSMKQLTEGARALREKLLADPHRPGYHVVAPEGVHRPFDPNGAIFWKGRYHLCYIYVDTANICHWAHLSSRDLLHWRHHPMSLSPTGDSPEKAIFSGNCFVNKAGAATMLYHGVGVGNCIATSDDMNLDRWKKLPTNPIIPNPPDDAKYKSWDPHGWLEGDTYYAIFGGKRPTIFKARELDRWEYVGDLFANTVPGVAPDEDVSCADLFELGGKHVLVCISHRMGARAYVGTWKNEQFHPEHHEQMSWVDNSFFAPESLVDERGRRIMWAWITDLPGIRTRTPEGWSGTLSLPRELTLGPDGRLRMRPIAELDALRYNPKSLPATEVADGAARVLDGIRGRSIEIDVEMQPGAGVTRCGLEVCRSPDGAERTVVLYDAAAGTLAINTTHASLAEGDAGGAKSVEAGPFRLADGEPLELRVYVDASVVEVFANGRQAVMRRIYPTRADAVGVALVSQGGTTRVPRVEAWDMMPSNPY